MPFLAPIAPAIPAIGGIIGGLFGRKSASKSNPWESQAIQTQTELDKQRIEASKMGMGMAKDVFPIGKDFLSSGRKALNPVLDYYSQLLGGDRQQMTSLLSPELQTISDQYSGANRSARELAPRSGGSSAFFQELPFHQSRDVSNLFSRVRSMAAEGLASTGTNLASLGGGILNTGSSLLSGATNVDNSPLLNYGLGRRFSDRASGEGFGQGISDILRSFDWKDIFGGD